MQLPRWLVALALLVGVTGAAAGAPLRRRTFGKSEKGKPFSGGFKMEGAPKTDNLFGDTKTFTREVDRYLALYDAMQRVRDAFSRSVQTALAELGAHQAAAGRNGTRTCPTERIALPYALSYHLGEDFRRSQAELGRRYAVIKSLDALGETAGLTPDYRWKVRRTLALSKEITTDWREMQAFFVEHLGKELAFFGCVPEQLIARGEAAGADALTRAADQGPPPTLTPPARPDPLRGKKPDAPPPVAATITFTVDNTSCPGALGVFLDGQPLGRVAAEARAAFAALVGPHDLCLIPDGSPQRCGDLGTVRRTYLHQGWTILLRCQK